MKNIALITITSLLSSGATVALYKWLDAPVRETVIIRNENNAARFTNNPNTTMVNSFTDAANLVRPSVVHIASSTGSGYEMFGAEGSSGSGVIVSEDGYILTNNHVIEGGKNIKVTLNDRREYSAKIIGTDPSTDLAVIKINDKDLKGRKLPVLDMANSDQVQVGEWVLAVGNPFNLTSTVTAGIVSAKGRNIDILEGLYSVESFIQTDAAVNPGNSGGALVDAQGRLVGINTAIITKSGRYEGYSFAVPVNLAKKVMEDLVEFGAVQRGFLGVTIKDVSNDLADQKNLQNLDGVYVDKVNSGSSAEEAGLRKGDIITRVNGVVVHTSPELQEQVALFRPGGKVKVEYWREGTIYETEVTLKNQNNTTDLGEKRTTQPLFQSKDAVLKDMGVEARELDSNELKRLKRKGVKVIDIRAGGLLDNTNMEKNFIITEVNDQKVETLEQLQDAVLSAKGKVILDGYYENYPGEYSYVFEKE